MRLSGRTRLARAKMRKYARTPKVLSDVYMEISKVDIIEIFIVLKSNSKLSAWLSAQPNGFSFLSPLPESGNFLSDVGIFDGF